MLVIQALKESLRIWWNHLVHLTMLNFLWFVCQLLVITGPPATAALYVLVNRVMQGEVIGGRDVVQVFRAVFIPAWKWALCNLIIVSALAGYLVWSRSQVGILADALGFLVVFVLAFGLAVNLYYWPLWLSQADTSVRNTFRNAVLMAVSDPVSSLGLLLACLIVATASALTILPLIHVMMVWYALFGLTVTRTQIERMTSRSLP